MTEDVFGWSFAGWLFGGSDRGVSSRICNGIRANDETAFATFYTQYYPAAVKFAYRYVRSRHAAQDLVQDVFATVWERRATLDFDGPILTYLLSAVRRRALDLMRHERIVARTESSAIDSPRSPPWMGAAMPSPDAAAEEAVLLATLQRAFRALPERQRAALVLRWEQGLTNREIGHVLNVGEAAVSRLLARATEALSGLV